MDPDHRVASAIISRLCCNALKGGRRHCARWLGTLGIRSAERALGEGPKADFYVRRAVIDSQIFSRIGSLSRRCLTSSSLRRKPPSGPALPGLGGVYLFLPSLSLEAKEGRSRLFDGRHGLCPCRDRESRSRSSTIFEARGPRLIERSLPLVSARRRTRAMTIFLRKCMTGGPRVDRSVDELTVFVSGR